MSLEAKDRLVRALVSVKLSTQLAFLCPGGEGGGGGSTACTGASSLHTAPQAVRLPVAQREMATQREDGHALPPPNHLQQTPV